MVACGPGRSACVLETPWYCLTLPQVHSHTRGMQSFLWQYEIIPQCGSLWPGAQIFRLCCFQLSPPHALVRGTACSYPRSTFTQGECNLFCGNMKLSPSVVACGPGRSASPLLFCALVPAMDVVYALST